jgi:D-glycero-alpha-D-manno-heptose-7-phosphate kinase
VAVGTNVDELYEQALAHGATAGKLLGAGGGGYLLLYVPLDRQAEVREALTARGGSFSRFAFEKHGLQVWRSRSN